MKKFLAAVLAAFATFSAMATGVPVLMYHEIVADSVPVAGNDTVTTVSAFNAHMKWLYDNGYRTVTTAQLAKYMNGTGTLPNGVKPVVISFDDGWTNQQNAIPGMKKYGFVGTFNVIASFPGASNSYMTWSNIKTLASGGHEIASHTYSHPYNMPITAAPQEILKSKTVIEQKIGRTVQTLAWPGGYFTDELLAYARSIGYIGTPTIDDNWCTKNNQSLEGTTECQWLTGNASGQNPFLMKRIFIDGRCTTAEFGQIVVQGHAMACTGAPPPVECVIPQAIQPSARVGIQSFRQDRRERDRIDFSNVGEDNGRGDDRARGIQSRLNRNKHVEQ